MNQLLSRKVTRQRKNIGDWVASDDHMTDEGRAEFLLRQQQRIAAAEQARQQNAAETARVVKPIIKRRA